MATSKLYIVCVNKKNQSSTGLSLALISDNLIEQKMITNSIEEIRLVESNQVLSSSLETQS